MTDDEVDREIERIERHERERDEAQDAIIAVARADLAGRLAGIWLEDEEETLFVAVTGDPADVERRLRAVAATPLRAVRAEHRLSDLEALAKRIWTAAEELGAWLSVTAVMERENAVEVGLEDLVAPASRALRERFAGEPVVWVEDKTEAVSASRADKRLRVSGPRV